MDVLYSKIGTNHSLMTTTRSTNWSITINNPTDTDEECIALARQKGWKVEGQKEVGQNGTPHYQLLVKTPQVRFSALKKQFPRAHIEVARNPIALSQYVVKEDTRVGALPTEQELYPSLDKFWFLLFEKFQTREFIHWHKDEMPYFPMEWNPESGLIKFYSNQEGSTALLLLDEAVGDLIVDGYRVESIAVNPATRSMFSRFHFQLFERCWNEISRRESQPSPTQTDRQSDSALETTLEASVPILQNANDTFAFRDFSS